MLSPRTLLLLSSSLNSSASVDPTAVKAASFTTSGHVSPSRSRAAFYIIIVSSIIVALHMRTNHKAPTPPRVLDLSVLPHTSAAFALGSLWTSHINRHAARLHRLARFPAANAFARLCHDSLMYM